MKTNASLSVFICFGFVCMLLIFSCNNGGTYDAGATDDTVVFPVNHLVSQEAGYIPYTSLASVDFDFDGDIDMMVSSWGDYPLLWYENDGTGTFTKHVFNDVTQISTVNRYSDADGDGDTDFTGRFVGMYSSNFSYYQNNGYNVFTQKNLPLSDTYIPDDFKMADINKDGYTDIVCTDIYPNDLIWIPMGSDGVYQTPVTVGTDFPGGEAVCTADLDNDGDMDIIASEYETDPEFAIVWWSQNFKGGFFRINAATGIVSPRLWAENIDGDGDTDIVVQSENTLFWLSFEGSNVFSPNGIFSSATDFNTHVIDYENDNDIDFFLYLDTEVDSDSNSYTEHELILLENDGNGAFTQTVLLSDIERSYVCPGDFNSDGYQDLFVMSNLDYSFRWYQFRE